jgi:hypothetical protein
MPPRCGTQKENALTVSHDIISVLRSLHHNSINYYDDVLRQNNEVVGED